VADHATHEQHGRVTLIAVLALFCVAVPWVVGCVPSVGGMRFQRQLATTEGPPTVVHPGPGDADGDGIPDVLEDELLRKYSPTALVAANDASLPASVDWIRARNDIAIDGPRVMGRVVPAHTFPASVRKGSRDRRDWVMYGHAFPRAGGGIVLQYWLYFPFNKGALVFFDHESDWEHTTVELDATLQPEQFILARHNNNAPGVRVRWDRVPKEGNHPVYLVAWGSHAAYMSAADAPLWEHVVDCPRSADGEPKLEHCPVFAWRAGGEPGRPSPVINVGERGAPRRDFDADGFFIGYGGLWGDPAVLKLSSAAPPGPPYQAGFCSDAAPGACG
jgi:hypothetical protein